MVIQVKFRRARSTGPENIAPTTSRSSGFWGNNRAIESTLVLQSCMYKHRSCHRPRTPHGGKPTETCHRCGTKSDWKRIDCSRIVELVRNVFQMLGQSPTTTKQYNTHPKSISSIASHHSSEQLRLPMVPQEFVPQPGVVMVTKLHGLPQIKLLEQSLCFFFSS